MARRVSSLLLALVFAVAAGLASDAEGRRSRRSQSRAHKPLLDKRAQLARHGFRRHTKRTRRIAATTVLTEHPSSLRMLKVQLRQLTATLKKTRGKPGRSATLLQQIERPLMTGDKQVREFRHQSLKAGLATAKMIDFEGKPMPPSVIPRYVAEIERAGLKPGLEGDRLLYLRLPGTAEKTPKDRALRREVFDRIVKTNLERALAGKPLPIDRLIVAQTQNLGQLLEVHTTYDRVAARAVVRAARQKGLSKGERRRVYDAVRRVQVVPLVETSASVMNADKLLSGYLAAYQKRYGKKPAHLVLFVAGSDLNRQVGPVAAQVARKVMRSRLGKLQAREPGVDIVPWIGAGSGPMRSGPGRFPELLPKLHPGMTHTIQPDQLDQKNVGAVLKAMGRGALRTRAPKLSAGREDSLVALGAAFADTHASISLRGSLATVRLANLLSPLKQRGRKASSSKVFVERGGQLFLRSVNTSEKKDASTYGRSLDISDYTAQISPKFSKQRRALERRQKSIDKLWPRGVSDTRAIKGAFARYVQGHALTTVSGLGRAIDKARKTMGGRELARLRPFITFLVKNDGFVLSRDRKLVRLRYSVTNPGLSKRQLDRAVTRYFRDVASLERFLGKSLEQLISKKDRTRYEQVSRRLYKNKAFVDYMRGKDLGMDAWVGIMKDLVPLLSNPSWNRIG